MYNSARWVYMYQDEGIIDRIDSPHTPGECAIRMVIPAVVSFPDLQSIGARIQML